MACAGLRAKKYRPTRPELIQFSRFVPGPGTRRVNITILMANRTVFYVPGVHLLNWTLVTLMSVLPWDSAAAENYGVNFPGIY